MHCCTGNGARALYYAWESILTCDQGRLAVNLLMNRGSRWADVDSFLPHTGRVDVRVKQPVELAVRIPEWVCPEQCQCRVNGDPASLTFAGRYAQCGRVSPNDVVTLTFPIAETTHHLQIEKGPYTVIRRGNDVVAIDPPGTNHPLYQRDHCRTDETPLRTVARFAPDTTLVW